MYRAAMEDARELFKEVVQPCPSCGQGADQLYWCSVTDAEVAWDAGTGRVGFLTVCPRCQRQVDFLVDDELTAIQSEQWRTDRTLI